MSQVQHVCLCRRGDRSHISSKMTNILKRLLHKFPPTDTLDRSESFSLQLNPIQLKQCTLFTLLLLGCSSWFCSPGSSNRETCYCFGVRLYFRQNYSNLHKTKTSSIQTCLPGLVKKSHILR